MQILDLWHEVDKILRSLWASLCKVVYQLIADLYDLFMNVAKVKILSQNDIKPIYQRVTLILAIIMVFYVTFEVVKYIISPDTITDKEKGASNIVKKMIIVVVLIAMVPTIFEKAYDLQNIIFENQLFSKIILGKQNTNMASYGKKFSANLFGMFYYVDETIWHSNSDLESEMEKGCDKVNCELIVSANLDMLANYGEMPFLNQGISDDAEVTMPGDSEEHDVYFITFDGLIALLVGLLVGWMLIMYTIDAGTRVAQLAFLQVIAPIPIIGYLSPKKDGIFQKWYKQCLSTYLDLFIRISVIYFILLLCDILGNAYHAGTLFNNIPDASKTMKTFIYVALILGLLAFAKRAPKMLEELFPKMSATSGSLGLSSKERVAPLAARAIGMGLGATTGLRNMVARGINTARRNRMLQDITGKSKKERKNDAKIVRDARKQARAEYAVARKQARAQGLTGNELYKATKKQRDNMRAKESAYADAQNKKNRSILGNAAAGLVGGAATGAKTGFGATEAKDIWKKGHKEANVANQKKLNSREEWLNSGGYSNIQRTISGIEQKAGISTNAARTEREIKTYEGKIKANEALAKIESDTKASRDKVEDRLTSKMEAGELKREINSIEVKDQNGNVIGKTINGMKGKVLDIKDNDTASTLYRRYKGRTEVAKQVLDAKIKAAPPSIDADVEMAKQELDARINSSAPQAEIDQAQQDYNSKKAIQDDIIAARDAFIAAENDEKAIRKYAMRNTFTEVLKDVEANRFNADNDPVAVDMINTMRETINVARNNSKTAEEFEQSLQKALDDGKISQAKYNTQLNAFRTGVYSDYDTLDDVVVRFQNLSTEKQRVNMAYSESKRVVESSDAYAAQKSDDSTSKPQ